jgi:ABC-2 type transport system ATP-binding protein
VGIINSGRLLMVEDKPTLLRQWGERRLVVTFSAPVAALPEAGVRMGAQLSEDGRTLTYIEREGSQPGGDLLRALYSQGLPIADVETRRSRLEDILIDILHGKPQQAA